MSIPGNRDCRFCLASPRGYLGVDNLLEYIATWNKNEDFTEKDIREGN